MIHNMEICFVLKQKEGGFLMKKVKQSSEVICITETHIVFVQQLQYFFFSVTRLKILFQD